MKAPVILKPGLKWAVKTAFPRQFWRYKFNAFTTRDHEHELRLVPLLCDRGKLSLDVGADAGVYSANMVQVSRDVIAFEPRPKQAAELQAMFDSVRAPVHVERVALSDREGTLVMRVLVNDRGRSTIESENPLEDEDESPQIQIEVKVRRLDDYGLDEVGFIKIDVEGHEPAVLHGARQTITQNQPNLLIEAEDRHRKDAVAEVTEFLQELGYDGFFLLEGRLHDISEFRAAEHQNSANIGSWKSGHRRRGLYINNFIFVPSEESDRLIQSVQAATLPAPERPVEA